MGSEMCIRDSRYTPTEEYRTPVIGDTPEKEHGLPVDDGWFGMRVNTKAAELKLKITGGVCTGWKIQTMAWIGNAKTEGRGVR